jgi:hypothetical protein
MGRLMDRRDGVPVAPREPDFDDLLRKSGSSSYKPKRVDGMSNHEFLDLATTLAPIESDGVDDQEEWNLFDEYLPMDFDDVEDLNVHDSLSTMLTIWGTDKVRHRPVSELARRAD